jgi:hypothetical protein
LIAASGSVAGNQRRLVASHTARRKQSFRGV